MIINKIKIDGYKNINTTEIQFDDITALVGLNNYGKSNVLEAIDFAKNFIRNPYQIKGEMMKFTKAIPINNLVSNKNFCFSMEYTTDFENRNYEVNYEFSFHWLDNNNISGIESEVLKFRFNEKGQKYNTYISRTKDKAFYKSSETGRCDKIIKIEDNNLLVNKLSNFDELYYLEILKELNKFNFDFNTFLDASNAFDFVPFEIKGGNAYDLDKKTGSNIGRVIYNLREDYNNKYQLLMDSFLTLFPNIESVEPQKLIFDKTNTNFIFNGTDENPFILANNIFRMMVKEKYNTIPHNFENLSNGTKRIFLLLTSVILADIHGIQLIAFEELENCIHPLLFQQLLIILTSIASECKIIITSHSPYLIQYLDLEKIYIGIPSNNGTAVFRKIKKSKQPSILKNAKEYGISTGDFIFELLVNSFEENEELCSYLECRA